MSESVALSEDLDGPQSPPYAKFFGFAAFWTGVLLVLPLLVQFGWMLHVKGTPGYRNANDPSSQKFPFCIPFGLAINLLIVILQRTGSNCLPRWLPSFLGSKSTLQTIMYSNLFLVVFPIMVFLPVVSYSDHSDFVFYRCKELCWLVNGPETNTSTRLAFEQQDNNVGTISTKSHGEDPITVLVSHTDSLTAACADYTDYNLAEDIQHWLREGGFIPDPQASFNTAGAIRYIFDQCHDIMNAPKTRIGKHLLQNGCTRLAFNLALRHFYNISETESALELLMGTATCAFLFSAYILVKRMKTQTQVRLLWFFRGLILRDKNRDANAKPQGPSLKSFYQKLKLVKDLSNWKNSKTELSDFSLYSLSELLKDDATKGQALGVSPLERKKETDNVNNRLDKIRSSWEAGKENRAGRYKNSATSCHVLGFFFWFGHALVGFLVRYLKGKYIFLTPGFAPSLLVSLIVGYITNVALWLSVVSCLNGVKMHILEIKALDAIFQFPGTDPHNIADIAEGAEDLEDPSSRPLLIERERHDFSLPCQSIKDLREVLRELEMWGNIRKELQIAQNTCKIDTELHLIIVVLTLLCRASVVVANYFGMAKGEGFTMSILNFVVAYDLIITCIVLLRATFLCKEVNDRYNNHIRYLGLLEKYVAVESHSLASDENTKSESVEAQRDDNVAFVQACCDKLQTKEQRDLDVAFVRAFRDKLQAMDNPMRLFGVVVNRATLAGTSTMALSFVVPSLWSIFQMLVAKAED